MVERFTDQEGRPLYISTYYHPDIGLAAWYALDPATPWNPDPNNRMEFGSVAEAEQKDLIRRLLAFCEHSKATGYIRVTNDIKEPTSYSPLYMRESAGPPWYGRYSGLKPPRTVSEWRASKNPTIPNPSHVALYGWPALLK